MPCYHPIPAYQAAPGTAPVLWPHVGLENLELPCGQCLGCLTNRAADWAKRAEHESRQWEHNCFLTLTYDESHVPVSGHLQPEDPRNFIKRLRRLVDRHNPAILTTRPGGVRYLCCGEYGEKNLRPHYHMLLFNCGFKDAYRVASRLLESPTLNRLWPFGQHRIGEVTGASANYVAQYTLKKVGQTVHTPDGEILPKPFFRMSLKPPIGSKWLTKYQKDLQEGYLVAEGKKNRVPRAYTKRLRTTDLPPGRHGPHPAHFNPGLAEQIQWRASQHDSRETNLDAAERIHQQRVCNAQRKI